MFGMKVANIRPSTNLGSQNGHANFKSWTDCVLDYALYQAAYLNRIKSEKEYYQYLSNNYAEDKRYVRKVKEIAEQIK
jgi:flagellum-specific peptidoglycan hydrolase FlgJ